VKGRPLLFLTENPSGPAPDAPCDRRLAGREHVADFEQIAEFCGLHILEVQAIADDTAATKLTGRDPIRAGELTHEEIEKGQADPDYTLQMHKEPDPVRRTKGPRYTPVSKRQDKPDGINWIIRNHPEVSDGQISKLIGTTRTTIAAIRDRTPLEHGQHPAEGPGDARPDHAARARCGGRQGAEGGRAWQAPVDTRFDSDREALIEELRAEREQHARDAEAALAAAEPAKRARDEIVPGIKDPFKRSN
jgi:hypothetical protein